MMHLQYIKGFFMLSCMSRLDKVASKDFRLRKEEKDKEKVTQSWGVINILHKTHYGLLTFMMCFFCIFSHTSNMAVGNSKQALHI